MDNGGTVPHLFKWCCGVHQSFREFVVGECSIKTQTHFSFFQVLCFGLSLPLTQHDTIRDCVNVYCEWFSALTSPRACVPKPVVDEPNLYGQEMLHHLYNLFVPRDNAGSANTDKQSASNASSQVHKASQGQGTCHTDEVCRR